MMSRYVKRTVALDRLCRILAVSDSTELLNDALDNGDINIVTQTQVDGEARKMFRQSRRKRRSDSIKAETDMKKAKQLYQKLVLGVNVSEDDDLSESDEEVEPDSLWNCIYEEDWSGDDESKKKVNHALENLLDIDQGKRSETKESGTGTDIEISEARPILCDQCGLVLYSWNQAIDHKKEKHPESSVHYSCPLCSSWFPFKDVRDRHLEHHQQIPPTFTCDECGVPFYSKGALGFHVRTLHTDVNKEVSTNEIQDIQAPPPSKKVVMNEDGFIMCAYYCHLCGMEYMSKLTLMAHVEKEHTFQEKSQQLRNIFRCTTCDAIFWNKVAFDAHRKYHTPEDMYIVTDFQGDSLSKRENRVSVSILSSASVEKS